MMIIYSGKKERCNTSVGHTIYVNYQEALKCSSNGFVINHLIVLNTIKASLL